MNQGQANLESFMRWVRERNSNEPEFCQAVEEVAETVLPFIDEHCEYKTARILERLVEPDRAISFRVSWEDDHGAIQINRGYRVQFSNAIGPYKGGLRFHPSVNISIIKFLGFEQVFKNSLTSLPLGGAKGGSDFDPKGKSDREVMRFCQAFMTELVRHIGPDCDVPAGDIGVGGREIGFLFGQYKRLRNEFHGVLTGKALEYGGSLIRPEATGYGCVYFMEEMLRRKQDSLRGKTCLVSGSGNVAQYTVEKAIQLGANVVTMSDSSGTIYDKSGITAEKLAWLMEHKNVRRGRIRDYSTQFRCDYFEGKTPWEFVGDIAFPCATQNEVDVEDAKRLIQHNCLAVGEGANMPTTPRAIALFREHKLLFSPGKASNAGGVSVSGLEMSQNSQRFSWTREEVDRRLQGIMKEIHKQCVVYGEIGNYVDYIKGANIAGFVKVANAMLAQGLT